MSTIKTNNITDATGSGAPNFANGLKLGTNAVLGPVTGDAPMYACRAWVNFSGTTTPPNIRASGNVSSITDNGVGDYTVNFTTALPHANYAAVLASSTSPAGANSTKIHASTATSDPTLQTTTQLRLSNGTNGAAADTGCVNLSIFC